MARLWWIAMCAPLGGCLIPILYPPMTCDGGDCPEPDPVAQGLYAVVDHSREDLVDGVVDVGADTVIVEYVDTEGRTWEVEYAVVGRTIDF